MREIDRHRNLQVIRMVRRDSDAAATEEHELRELGEGEAARVLADKLGTNWWLVCYLGACLLLDCLSTSWSLVC